MINLLHFSRMAIAALFLVAASAAEAITFPVTTTANTGPGSLYEAVTNCNLWPNTGMIVFDLPGSGPHIIDLTSPLPFFNKDMQIINDNPGDEPVTVRRSPAITTRFGIFSINPGHSVVIAGLTIANGYNENGAGGITNNRSALTVRNCNILDNHGYPGGGIINETSFGDGPATLNVVNCTLTGNSSGARGGAIQNQGSSASVATATVTNCIISNNTSGYGGGISNYGAPETTSLTLTNGSVTGNTTLFSGGGIDNVGTLQVSTCTISHNTVTDGFVGAGGGIYSTGYGHITVSYSTVSGNSATYGGGVGLEQGDSTMVISDSTLSSNNAKYSGGAFYNYGGATVTMTNCTLSGNAISNGTGGGGGIYNEGTGHNLARIDVINSTIAGNSAGVGGGIRNGGYPANTIVTLVNTVLKTGQSGTNIVNSLGGRLTSLGHNLSSDSAEGDTGTGPGGLLNAAGDIRNMDPQLGMLANNGGVTQTHALLPWSPAINSGDDARAPTVDQRGVSRVGVSDRGAFEFEIAIPSSFGNISTRLRVLAEDNALIGGMIATGTAPKRVIIRAIGPSLTGFGVPGALENPTLDLFQGSTLLFSNDDWNNSTQQAEIAASGLAPSNNLESAIIWTLTLGQGYTAVVRGKDGTTGVGIVEAFDLDPGASSKLGNISTRGFVDVDDNVMIAGLIVSPSNGSTTKVLVRALGPTLGDFGVAGALADPTLDLVNSSGTVIRSNDNWKDDAQQRAAIEAANLAPSHDEEAALVDTVAPGAYTAIVRGNNRATGVGLVEAYNLQ
jgi:hypothetical protein